VHQLWTAAAYYDKGQRRTIATLVSAQTRREGIFRRIPCITADACPHSDADSQASEFRALTDDAAARVRGVGRRPTLATSVILVELGCTTLYNLRNMYKVR
jgi:hypothetical protein